MERARDMGTGDYTVTDGKPDLTDSLAPACRARVRGHRTRWLYKPDDDWGSDLYSYRKKKSVDFRDGLGESIVLKALQPLEEDLRADNIEVETQFSKRGGVAFAVNLLDLQRREELPVTIPVGVPR